MKKNKNLCQALAAKTGKKGSFSVTYYLDLTLDHHHIIPSPSDLDPSTYTPLALVLQNSAMYCPTLRLESPSLSPNKTPFHSHPQKSNLQQTSL